MPGDHWESDYNINRSIRYISVKKGHRLLGIHVWAIRILAESAADAF